jgi:hypothetical protein
VSLRKTNAAYSYLHMKTKIVSLIETESRIVVTRGGKGCGGEGNGDRMVNSTEI